MSSTHDRPAPAAGAGAGAGETGRQYVPRPAPRYDDDGYAPAASGAAMGLTAMAAVLMMLSGLWSFLEGRSW